MELSLGAVLRKAREVRGFSSVEAARLAGISTAYLSKLEADVVKRPSPQVLHPLSEALAVPYAELMRLAGYRLPSESSEPPEAATSRVNAALFADLTDDERDELLDYLAWYRARRKSGRHAG